MMAYFSFLIRRLKEDGEYHEEEMAFAEGETFFEAVTAMLREHGQYTWIVKNLGMSTSTHMPTA